MKKLDIRSDVAGRVWQVLKAPGDTVAAGEPVIVIEAMKMEIPVAPDADGSVAELLVAEGDEVTEDQVIATLETGA